VELKNIFAKNMIQQKRYSLAYNIAASHNGHCNMDKSDAQWLAGWIALKFLHNPELAYKHFSKMHKIVKKPIGRSRAAYWLGMSTKALKKKEESHKWFREAASLNFTFYGQMAMLELGQTSFTLPPNPKISEQDKAFYRKNEFARAANFFLSHDKIECALAYAKAAVSTAKNPGEAALIISSFKKTNNKFYILELAKAAACKGFLYGFLNNNPTPYKIPSTSIDPALTYAIIQKESAFDARAISKANAHGLMQLIPDTGCKMQKKLRHKCSVQRLTSDPMHNIALGNKYLEDMLKRWNGSYILTAASYNAGPEPVERWVQKW
jgi:soluble lytic murein transglycosylase